MKFALHVPAIAVGWVVGVLATAACGEGRIAAPYGDEPALGNLQAERFELDPAACEPLADTTDYPAYCDLNDAITQLGSTPSNLVVYEPMVLGATSVTVPSTVTLNFVGAGQISVGAGETLTIHGPIDAAGCPIFAQDVAGVVELSPGDGTAALEVYPQWWGAQGDGSTDDRLAIQQAIDSLVSGGTVFIPDTGTAYIVNWDDTNGRNDKGIGIVLDRPGVHIQSNGAFIQGYEDSADRVGNILIVGRRYAYKQVLRIDENEARWENLHGFGLKAGTTFAKGDSSIQLTVAHANRFAVGDTVLFATLGGNSDTPYLFEFKTVASKNAGIITFEAPIKIPNITGQSYRIANISNGDRIKATIVDVRAPNQFVIGDITGRTNTKSNYWVGSNILIARKGAHTMIASGDVKVPCLDVEPPTTGEVPALDQHCICLGIEGDTGGSCSDVPDLNYEEDTGLMVVTINPSSLGSHVLAVGDSVVIRNNLLLEDASVEGLKFDGSSDADLLAVFTKEFSARSLEFTNAYNRNGKGAVLAYSWGTTFENSTIAGKKYGLQGYGLDTATITGSSFINSVGFGLFLDEPCGWTTISANVVQGNGSTGMLLKRLFYSTVSDNLLVGNAHAEERAGQRRNLLLWSSLETEISECTMDGLELDGYVNFGANYKAGDPDFYRDSYLSILRNQTTGAPIGGGATFNDPALREATALHELFVEGNQFSEGYNLQYVEDSVFRDNTGQATVGNNVNVDID